MIDGAARSRGSPVGPSETSRRHLAGVLGILLLLLLPPMAQAAGKQDCLGPTSWPQRSSQPVEVSKAQRPIDHAAPASPSPLPSPLPGGKFAWAGGETRGRVKRLAPGQPQPHLGAGAGAGTNLNQPRLVQWSREALQYYEGSTLVLSCSLAISSQLGRPLKFSWFRQGKALQPDARLSMDSLSDYSFLRLTDLRASDSGQYACVATNSLGQEDRTSTQVLVNVRLKWLAPPDGAERNSSGPVETVRVGQSIGFDCSAAGQPRPRIRWFRLVPLPEPATKLEHQMRRHHGAARLDAAQVRAALLQLETPGHQLADGLQRLEIGAKDGANESSRWRQEVSTGGQHELHSRLVLDRAEAHHSGLYECEVTAEGLDQQQHQHQQQQQGDDRLRKLFGLAVNGRCISNQSGFN